MVACSAYRCTNSSNYSSGRKKKVSFHKFPADQDLRNRWIRNIHRDSFQPNENHRLCGDHFEPSCFEEFGAISRLKKDAVPRLFPTLPLHLQPRLGSPRKLALKRQQQQLAAKPRVTEEPRMPEEPRKNENRDPVSDHNYSLGPLGTQQDNMKVLLQRAIRCTQSHRRKLRRERLRCQRYLRKIKDLKETVAALSKQRVLFPPDGDLEADCGGGSLRLQKVCTENHRRVTSRSGTAKAPPSPAVRRQNRNPLSKAHHLIKRSMEI